MKLLVTVDIIDTAYYKRRRGFLQYLENICETEFARPEDFDLEKIFECGQCFRWNAQEDGSYVGVAMGKVLRIRAERARICISASDEEFKKLWYDYFDLSRDYAKARKAVSLDAYTSAAAEYGKGIRILRQDSWEALCSFIISQCNNISRIKKIIESLCSLFGEPIEFEGREYYGFPSAEKLASLEAEALAPIRCGYRAPYIIEAARAVSSGALSLSGLAAMKCPDAVRELKKINGIGDKVANCVVLFGLNIPDAFPLDVWMKKALKAHYPPDFDPSCFGENAGLAQQYIFYYARSGNV